MADERGAASRRTGSRLVVCLAMIASEQVGRGCGGGGGRGANADRGEMGV